MAKYWYELLDYLGYDPAPTKIYMAVFDSKFPKEEEKMAFFKMPISEQNKISRQILNQAVFKCLKYKIKRFFE